MAAMVRKAFQFNLRTLFWTTTLVAIGCLTIRAAIVAGPYWFKRPHQRRVEKRYAEKVAEIERLREVRRRLPEPDFELENQIRGMEYELNFEEVPESLGGGVSP